MKLFIAKPDDRDTVLMILGRNGYTVRQGKEKKPGESKYSAYVEVVQSAQKRDE